MYIEDEETEKEKKKKCLLVFVTFCYTYWIIYSDICWYLPASLFFITI